MKIKSDENRVESDGNLNYLAWGGKMAPKTSKGFEIDEVLCRCCPCRLCGLPLNIFFEMSRKFVPVVDQETPRSERDDNDSKMRAHRKFDNPFQVCVRV